MKTSFELVDYLVLIGYLLFVLIVGIKVAKKEMKGKEYFRGDGTIPWWVTAVSLFATMLSPISYLTLAGRSFKGDWSSWVGQLGIFLAVPLTIMFFLPVYKKLNIDTAYEYLEKRFDKRLRLLGSLMFIVFQIGRMSIVMYLPALALSLVTKVDINILIVLMGIIAIIYSYVGGIKSVLWTDFIQGIVLSLGAVFVVIFLCFTVKGGFSEIISMGVKDSKFLDLSSMMDINIFKESFFITLIGAGFGTLSSYVSSQDMVQRYTTTTNIKEMKKMTYLNGLLSIGVATLFFFIGTGLYAFYTQNPTLLLTHKEDQVFASYIVSQLPAGISGLLLAGIFAAGQSTLSSGLNSVATSWTLDVHKVLKGSMDNDKATSLAKFLSLAIGIVSIVVSIILAHSNLNSAFAWFNGFIGMVLGLVGGLFGLGVFSKKANSKGALLGFVVAVIVSVGIKYYTKVNFWAYSIISIAVCMIFGYIFSLMFKEKVKDNINELTIYGISKNDLNGEENIKL
ncbi:sodium:solute symporter [Clostridium botulinum]|uniref:Sodium:solute symporter n=2 Tax=Clostridium botulinum TaxID=1491 RepID=A0A0A0IMI7_CLOBO|nr:sodium:solute symporter [Clostridium botulinum]KEI07512.1 sodium:solute symporter [Clostridium botulinum C/D str. BKT75002]KEI09880.1 sodium:solute symporter [Clostridium botulinum C/D str. BKT2873]KGN00726.1 sodium:solute symporter [Clostridium botulinum C/D str. DC5]KOC53118.1 sodium:solute symporter [Clostridium botulinum]KOC58491.1 sodium:solute symporter [Clostridium botulinum]